MQDFFNQTFFGNRLWDYLIFIISLLCGMILIRLFKTFLFRHLKKWSEKTTSIIDDYLINSLEKKIIPFLYYSLIYFSLYGLTLNSFLKRGISILGLALLTFYSVQFGLEVLSWILEFIWVKKEVDQSRKDALKGIILVCKGLVWGLAVVILLDNLGVKISGLVAGLGIGGVAVALGAQAVLGDLFSYFTIFFDRPFEIGDFVVVGDLLGSVEYIGVKTTRLRSLSGEQVILANSDLTNSRVRNYKRMKRRRILFQIGVTYETNLVNMKAIPEIVKGIISGFEDAALDRVHFASYGDFSLIYEIVYYVIGNDYNRYMDIQQEINFKIKEEFDQRGIEFAYPTQTLFLKKEI
jgi:small-conductance mechanosensitive channel